MNLGLFEDAGFERLLPLTWLRPAFQLRVGRDLLIDKIRAHVAPQINRVWSREPLRRPLAEQLEIAAPQHDAEWLLLNARAFVSADIVPPPLGTAWMVGDEVVAAMIPAAELELLKAENFLNPQWTQEWVRDFRMEPAPNGLSLLRYPWDLMLANEAELRRQCEQCGKVEGEIYPGVHLINEGAIGVGPNARVKSGAVLDAENGPIQIDADVLIEPNVVISGPCYIGPGSVVRAGSTIHGGCSIGPVCKVGGELDASVLLGYSNKQHDGFLGHSYVASWVNLGADTVTSDLKNTYGSIRVQLNGVGVETGQMFVGAIIGDHSKTGINSTLPTGAILGVCANVFTQSAVPKFVPSFSWLTEQGLSRYRTEKAVTIARTVMARREIELTEAEEKLIEATAELAPQIEAAGWPK